MVLLNSVKKWFGVDPKTPEELYEEEKATEGLKKKEHFNHATWNNENGLDCSLERYKELLDEYSKISDNSTLIQFKEWNVKDYRYLRSSTFACSIEIDKENASSIVPDNKGNMDIWLEPTINSETNQCEFVVNFVADRKNKGYYSSGIPMGKPTELIPIGVIDSETVERNRFNFEYTTFSIRPAFEEKQSKTEPTKYTLKMNFTFWRISDYKN